MVERRTGKNGEDEMIYYLCAINALGLFAMWLDKRKARRHEWRIPEKTLFLVSLIGGSVGTLAGMYLFHHKTRHWYFVIGMPLILVVQIGVGVLICNRISL